MLQLDHTLPCTMNCKFFGSYFGDNINRIDTMIDLAGAFSLVRFPMGMSGGQVAGCSQNTTTLPISVSINRAR